MLDWIQNYFQTLHECQMNTKITNRDGDVVTIDDAFTQFIAMAKKTRDIHSKIMFVGNGGSAGICSHLAIDFSKNGGLPAMAFSDIAAATCLSNDYGYEYIFSKQVEFHGRKDDLLIAISSSGKSKNILNAVEAAKKLGCQVVTFSGFQAENPLSQSGDLNFYVDSMEYGFVEVAHVGLIHAMLDNITQNQAQLTEKAASAA